MGTLPTLGRLAHDCQLSMQDSVTDFLYEPGVFVNLGVLRRVCWLFGKL